MPPVTERHHLAATDHPCIVGFDAVPTDALVTDGAHLIGRNRDLVGVEVVVAHGDGNINGMVEVLDPVELRKRGGRKVHPDLRCLRVDGERLCVAVFALVLGPPTREVTSADPEHILPVCDDLNLALMDGGMAGVGNTPCRHVRLDARRGALRINGDLVPRVITPVALIDAHNCRTGPVPVAIVAHACTLKGYADLRIDRVYRELL